MRRLAVLLVAVAGLAIACAGIPGRERRASDIERRAYAEAVAPLPGDPSAAAALLESFLTAHRESPLADDAALKLAEIAQTGGDPDAARDWYAFVVQQFPRSDRSDPARLALARIEATRGNTAVAASVMAKVRLSRLSPAERTRAHRLLVDLSADPVARLRWLASLRADTDDPDALALVDVEIDEILASLDDVEVDRAAEQIGRRVPGARIHLRAAELALDSGNALRADAALDRASRLPLAPAYRERLAELTQRVRLREGRDIAPVELPSFAEALLRGMPDTTRASGTLGVVLPLTGPFAHIGEASLRGILLAAGVFDAVDEPALRPNVRVVVRDTAGDPARAAAAVRELASEDDLLAIIGPLLSESCDAAAEAAEASRIPIVTLTARDEIATGRSYAFRTRTMATQEVEVLVDYAMGVLEAERFAVLYPQDAYGRGLRGFFWDAVEARGGHVVAVASYDPTATDFAEPIRKLVGYVLLSEAEKAAIREREDRIRGARRLTPGEALLARDEARAMTGPNGELLPPIIDFDAIFIPESQERVVLIAPQLAFHEVEGMHLLGPSGWNHPDLVRIGREHVEGAVFAANFHAESQMPQVRRFSDRYETTFGLPADDLAAQSYDAANLVLIQVARGYRSRSAIRDSILATRAYAGASGVLAMRADGNASRRPFLLGVQRGRIVSLDGP